MTPEGRLTPTLPPERERFVREEASRGAFASRGDYVRDLVREHYLRQSKLAALARGLQDADAGRVMDVDEAARRLRAEIEAA